LPDLAFWPLLWLWRPPLLVVRPGIGETQTIANATASITKLVTIASRFSIMAKMYHKDISTSFGLRVNGISAEAQSFTSIHRAIFAARSK
jgi:hypothetical protein